jgi:hypothetical protein
LRGQPQQPQQQQPQQLPPQLQPLIQQVQTLTQQAEENRMRPHLDAVAQFASDPANVYFENVRGRMRTLIQTGQARDLPDAYQQACWSDPQVRPLMLQQQQQAQAQAAEAAARARAAGARHASGSITGSPAPGATPGRGGLPAVDLREQLLQSWDEHA